MAAAASTGRPVEAATRAVKASAETVGTTTLNLSEDSIQEFQVAQSTLDPATNLTTSGSVNVITRSGANRVHGSGFYLFRNDATAARVAPIKAPFERDQVGVRAGGPFLKDKLFWFVNYEHTLQHGTTFTEPSAPFSSFANAFASTGTNPSTMRISVAKCPASTMARPRDSASRASWYLMSPVTSRSAP